MGKIKKPSKKPCRFCPRKENIIKVKSEYQLEMEELNKIFEKSVVVSDKQPYHKVGKIYYGIDQNDNRMKSGDVHVNILTGIWSICHQDVWYKIPPLGPKNYTSKIENPNCGDCYHTSDGRKYIYQDGEWQEFIPSSHQDIHKHCDQISD